MPLESLPLLDEVGKLVLVPEVVIETKERKLHNKTIREYLIRWKDLPYEDATWEAESIL